MSRQILISAVYGNGKKCTYGVFSGQNAAYKTSVLHADELKQKIEMMKQKIKGKKVKKFVVWSMTSDARNWYDHTNFEWIANFKKLSDIDIDNLIDINNTQFTATI